MNSFVEYNLCFCLDLAINRCILPAVSGAGSVICFQRLKTYGLNLLFFNFRMPRPLGWNGNVDYSGFFVLGNLEQIAKA